MNQAEPLSEGFLLVNKAAGLTSFQVVKKVRYLSQVKKVGHAGTLDPMAEGLLVIALGRPFTRQIASFQSMRKTYVFRMVLGIETDTLDAYGSIVREAPAPEKISADNIIARFVGVQEQYPPLFSAKKKDGKRLYQYARQGEAVDVTPSTIEIFRLTCLDIRYSRLPVLTFEVECSKGTYVRSLVRDIGAYLGVPAYTKDLIRTHIGSYSIEHACPYAHLDRTVIQSHVFRYTER